MMDNFYKKSLIYMMTIVFFLAGVIPGTIGYTGEMSVQSFNDDYVNAYWKFDEGSGTTAHDSAHDYDGTIYGATWVTGYSGKALDFDGVNDYVSFDDHAKDELGFNKSDDAIFSFYFKSSSSDKGIIYSICRGDAYGYNPGTHIALNANGTIELKVWRLGCGLLTYTDHSYNDGDWHYVEARYDGVYSHEDDCIGRIYVDGDLDGTSTYPVCAFYSDNFRYAQIGKNSSDSTEFFDGVIDEFKIINYPGGNEQAAPVIDGPTSGNTGVEYDYTFTTDDPEGDEIWIKIDWGDGDVTGWLGPYDSGEVVTKSHSWDDAGTYSIKAKSKDIWHESDWSDSYEVEIVVVENHPPNTPANPDPEDEETNVDINHDLSWTCSDPDGDSLTYDVYFGTSSNPPRVKEGQSATTYNPGTMDYSTKYYWKIKAIDEHGATKTGPIWEFTTAEEGANQPPGAPDVDGPTQGKVEVEYDYTFVTSDPEGDDVYYRIDWGDGQVEDWFGPHDSGKTVTKSHTWSSQETYTIKAKAKDADGAESGWGELTVTISNKNKAFTNPVFIRFLERLSERFPIVFKMLNHLLEL